MVGVQTRQQVHSRLGVVRCNASCSGAHIAAHAAHHGALTLVRLSRASLSCIVVAHCPSVRMQPLAIVRQRGAGSSCLWCCTPCSPCRTLLALWAMTVQLVTMTLPFCETCHRCAPEHHYRKRRVSSEQLNPALGCYIASDSAGFAQHKTQTCGLKLDSTACSD